VAMETVTAPAMTAKASAKATTNFFN
jgi:hypothetical protein